MLSACSVIFLSSRVVWDETPHIPVNLVPAIMERTMKTVTHPSADRYMNLRELCHLMGLPEHFAIDPKDVKYIGKAVPSTTARDMAKQVKGSGI